MQHKLTINDLINNDIRRGAIRFHNLAEKKAAQGQIEDAFYLSKQAATVFATLPNNDRNDDDWRNLAECLNNTGIWSGLCKNTEYLEIDWYNNAIAAIKQISHFTIDDYRDLACYLSNAYKVCQQQEQQIDYLKNAILYLNEIPAHEKNIDDWRELAKYYYWLGALTNDCKLKINYVLMAIEYQNKIPKPHFTEKDWNNLFIYQGNLETAYKTQSQYSLYNTGLTTFNSSTVNTTTSANNNSDKQELKLT